MAAVTTLVHLNAAPMWALIAHPGHNGELCPEVADARRLLAAHIEVAAAVEAVLVRRALIAAARAASGAPDHAPRSNAHYEVLAELLTTLFSPRATPTPKPVTN